MADEALNSLPEQRTILNKALVLLGASRRIDSVDDRDDKETENLRILWDLARRAAIELHPWNFALMRKRVAREAGHDPIDSGYECAFRVPVEMLRWLPWDRTNEHWFEGVEEGGLILTNHDGPLLLRGVRDVPEVGRWSALFADVMAYTLAVEYCQGKTQLVGLRDRLTAERGDKLIEAFRVDGAKTGNRERAPNQFTSRWAGARFRPNGYYGR